MASSEAQRAHQGWSSLGPDRLDAWTARLFEAGAPLYQLPYWNEPLRRVHFRPRYLVYGQGDSYLHYACILTLGVPGARVGLVQRGPVSLVPGTTASAEVMTELVDWARRRGYVFLRFTHDCPEQMALLSQLSGAREIEPFPLYRDVPESLLVDQSKDDEEALKRLHPDARNSLRRAKAAGYRIEASDSPGRLRTVWPLFEALAQRRGYSYRPCESFASLLQLAQPHQGARLYVASLDDRPVQALLVARSKKTAHLIISALDREAITGRETPSILTHWQAMRDFSQLDTQAFDLGTRSGDAYEFKRKFRPVERTNPPPVAIILSPLRFQLWSTCALPYARRFWRQIKRIVRR